MRPQLLPKWEARLPQVEAQINEVRSVVYRTNTVPDQRHVELAQLQLLAKRLRNAIRLRRYVDTTPLRWG